MLIGTCAWYSSTKYFNCKKFFLLKDFLGAFSYQI